MKCTFIGEHDDFPFRMDLGVHTHHVGTKPKFLGDLGMNIKKHQLPGSHICGYTSPLIMI